MTDTLIKIIYLVLFIILTRALVGFAKKPIVRTCGVYESCDLYGGVITVEEGAITCTVKKE